MRYNIIISLIMITHKKEKRSCMYFIVVFAEYVIGCIRIHFSCIVIYGSATVFSK